MISDLKGFLDEWVFKMNVPAYIETDPVQFPLQFTALQDREVVAFLTATITWGNRKMILQSANKMLTKMGSSPYDFVMSEGYTKLQGSNIHRTFFEKDLAYLCKGLRACYLEFGGLEAVFARKSTLWEGIDHFRNALAAANGDIFSKHVSNPNTHSACKRLHLALRWLVRNDGIVDLGDWTSISPSELYIPLDVHVGRVSRKLGLLSRIQNDRRAVEALTELLRGFNPLDPVIYDFALFGIGESKLDLNDIR
ncbi:MAG TPA: TIGR02757 family protein [Bacteroidales bacterium]|nr:TIGR02757 family protein [Bacteroidales bacterium]